jgi:hypothetical protein
MRFAPKMSSITAWDGHLPDEIELNKASMALSLFSLDESLYKTIGCI